MDRWTYTHKRIHYVFRTQTRLQMNQLAITVVIIMKSIRTGDCFSGCSLLCPDSALVVRCIWHHSTLSSGDIVFLLKRQFRLFSAFSVQKNTIEVVGFFLSSGRPHFTRIVISISYKVLFCSFRLWSCCLVFPDRQICSISRLPPPLWVSVFDCRTLNVCEQRKRLK